MPLTHSNQFIGLTDLYVRLDDAQNTGVALTEGAGLKQGEYTASDADIVSASTAQGTPLAAGVYHPRIFRGVVASQQDSDLFIGEMENLFWNGTNEYDPFAGPLNTISNNLSTLSDNVDAGFLATAGDIAALSGDVSTLSGNVDAGFIAVGLATDAISAAVDVVSGNVDDLTSAVGTVSTNVDALTSTLGTVSGNLDSLTIDVGTISTNVDNLTSSVSTVSSNLDSLTSDVSDVAAAVAALQLAVDNLPTNVPANVIQSVTSVVSQTEGD
jgi:methyl-accepting chemotaxis protein